MADPKDNKQPDKAKANKAEAKPNKKAKNKKAQKVDFSNDPSMAKYNALFVESEDKEVLEKSMLVALGIIFVMLFVTFPEFAARLVEDKQEQIVIETPKKVDIPKPKEEKKQEQKQVKKERKEQKFSSVPDVKAPTDDAVIVSDEEIRESLNVDAEDVGMTDFGMDFEAPGPVEVAGDINRPVPNFPSVQPFPSKAKIMRRSGEVKVRLQVNADGSFEILEFIYEKPPGFGFKQACEQYLQETTFQPATRNGKPIDVYYNLTIRFSLN